MQIEGIKILAFYCPLFGTAHLRFVDINILQVVLLTYTVSQNKLLNKPNEES